METELDSTKLALSFGSQAFDKLESTDNILKNEASKIKQLMMLVEKQDSTSSAYITANKQLLELNKALEYDIKREKRKRTWRSIKNVFIGVVIGGGATYAATQL